MAEPIRTIKIKPLYSLLLIGLGQLYGASVIFRLGALTIREEWINAVSTIAALGLMGWSFYLFYSFSKFYRLEDNKIIIRKNNLSLFGIEIKYSDITGIGIDTSENVLTANLYLTYLDEPIPIVSKFMKLQEFHFLMKILIEKT